MTNPALMKIDPHGSHTAGVAQRKKGYRAECLDCRYRGPYRESFDKAYPDKVTHEREYSASAQRERNNSGAGMGFRRG